MKAVFYNIYKVLRLFIVLGIGAFATIFILLYLILLIPSVQDSLKGVAEEELSNVLKTNVDISELSIEPFNKIVIYDLEINDQNGEDLIKIDKLGAGFSWYNLLLKHRLVFTHAELIGLEGNVYKQNKESESNIKFLIDALSSKDKTKPSKNFDISIYNIVLRKSSFSYNLLSDTTYKETFDFNHINIKDLRADISLPRLKNDNFTIKVKRLSFVESSGLDVKNISVDTKIEDQRLNISEFKLEMPNSIIKTDELRLDYPSLKDIGKDISKLNLSIDLTKSYVTLCDLSCFVPHFSTITYPIDINLKAKGTVEELNLYGLYLSTDKNRLEVSIKGTAENISRADSVCVKLPRFYVSSKSNEIIDVISGFIPQKNNVKKFISNCGYVTIDTEIEGNLNKAICKGYIATALGKLNLSGNIESINNGYGYKGNVFTKNFNVGSLLDKNELLGETAFNLSLKGKKTPSGVVAGLVGNIDKFEFKGYQYNNITADFSVNKSQYNAELTINDENLDLSLLGNAIIAGTNSKAEVDLSVSKFNFATANISDKYPYHDMSFNVKALASGNNISNLSGELHLNDFNYTDSIGEGITIDNFNLIADNSENPYKIDVKSDILNGTLVGLYDFNNIVPAIKQIIAQVSPSLFEEKEYKTNNNGVKNNFKYSFTIEDNYKTNAVLNFFKVPVNLEDLVTLNGYVNESNNSFDVDINAPFLSKKKKLIKNTWVKVGVDSINPQLNLWATTIMPSKKGEISLNLEGNGKMDCLNTNLGWVVDREGQFYGNIDLTTILGRVNETNKLMSTITVNPTEIVFNDTLWNVHSSKIGIYNKSIRVDNFRATSDDQYIWIDGRSSQDSDENIVVELQDINLDYIFDILQINNVVFGGNATGKVLASNVLSKTPKLETERFHVDNMTYNNSLLGDADLRSFWDNDKKFVAIQALISQPNGKKSNVDGEIYPKKDSLRFDFNAEKLDARFMKPFLAAITSDVDGLASGHVRLYGKFSSLDLSGDVYVEDLKFKVDYTNVYYWASDSIIIRPGLIKFTDINIKDRDGNTALFNGYVKHNHFRDMAYDIRVTDAKSILCYDIPEKKIDSWYGTIFGNGSVSLNGSPGVMKIDVGMSTAQNSKFYFELSSEETAVEYNFITFTDKKKEEIERIRIANQTKEDSIMNKFKKKHTNVNTSSTRIVVNIKADVNPLGQLILVMDPIAGDKIKATGSGTVTVVYDSNSDLEVRGKYTLEKGLYNFTLQDIIRKDFIINEGSYIYFDGDPYQAQIDIDAVYALNANLQDLDEGFASDKELTRTNVPVHAVLNVTGSIAEPDINFDLQFPTLSSDAYRKVKSIVSTDDMMNRQIIYLLALNRFYTPEYMGGTNRNNELASVASSTVSSQLSSMLGQISDNWSIAPNFKSDRGDFTDVEVNLALSSQLLNNRLLFNGNFGYRDKMATASNSNFIGDFDIEYLLNKAGNIRLKAYNHFNDQNYYVKNALTTQGVGVVFKYDFDKIFRSKRKENKTENDSLKVDNELPQDTIIVVK